MNRYEPWATSDAVRAVMRGQSSGRDTAPEMAVRRELHRRGLRYRVGYRPLPGVRRTVDVAFTRVRVAVLIDGCLWHGCPDHSRPINTNAEYWRAKIQGNVARDLDTTTRLRAAGWEPLRFWEHEDPSDVADSIEAVVRARLITLSADRPSDG